MRTNEAIILAGGLGTRLQGELPGITKCMAPIGGKPFLTYVLNYLEKQEINKVILSVGYRKDQITSYFGNYFNSVSIEYAIENEPLGTGGAVKLAMEFCKKDNVFVFNGDTYFTPDIQAMENIHYQANADITIAVKHLKETSRYGLIKTDNSGRITDFNEKDPSSGKGLINGGIYLVNRNVITNLEQNKFSLENDVFKVSCSSLQIHAFQTEAFFLDIGIPEDYARAQTLIADLK